MNWRPISTAPKDRAVLVYGPALDPQGVKFTSNVRTAMPSGDEWIGHGDYFRLQPTHWMPLPEAPEHDQNGNGTHKPNSKPPQTGPEAKGGNCSG